MPEPGGMSGRRIYLLGLILVLAAGAGVAALVRAAVRVPSLVALLIGVVVQAPLGWWLIRSVGTSRFLGVWVFGILARFLVLGVVALLVYPMVHWPLAPALLILGGVLIGLLLVEALVIWLEQSRT